MTARLAHPPATDATGDATASGHDPIAAQLAPVRSAVLDEARAEADRLLAEARTRADEQVADAQQEVDDAVAAARRRTAEAAGARARSAVARARRDQHAEVLGAQAELRAELRGRVVRAVRALRDDSRYPALLDALEGLARAQLGDGATVERDPEGGGVVATDRGRRVDYTLEALGERAFAALEEEGAALWS